MSIIAKVDKWIETLEKISSKKVTTYLEGGRRELQTLFAKIRLIESYNVKITDYLDPVVRKYCQVANIVDKCLVMIVANSSIATQLRFQTHDLLQRFKEDSLLRNIKEIQYKVRPYTHSRNRFNHSPPKELPLLSKETATIIHSIAESLEDPALRIAMEKIASHVKK